MTTTRWMVTMLALLAALLVASCDDEGEITPPSDDDDAVADDDDTVADDDDFTQTVPQGVTLTTSDGLSLSGTFQPAAGVELGPAVLLLHQFNNDSGDFSNVWFVFLDAGISVLAIDFRSHGDSDEAAVPLDDLLTDPNQLKWDVLAGLEYLADQPMVDPARIGVMGLSVGANMAGVANHNREAWGVKATCSLSARKDRIETLAETTTLDLAAAQWVAAIEEEPQATMAQELFDITVEPSDLRLVLDTGAHGADLLAGSPDAQNGTVAWFVAQL